jgi:parvulin-like peptidyl-prolyl isomerase
MTFRAGPVKRSSRQLGGRDRRNLYLNIAFGVVVVVAVLILAAAAGATWYGQHLAAVAHVNGQSITKDDLNRRAEILAVQLNITSNRLQTEHSAGRLSESDWEQQKSYLSQAQQRIGSTALEQLIDERVLAQLAAQQGIAVTPDQIEAKLTEEATLPEQRRVWVIEVEPKVDEGKDDPTDQQKADAKKAADEALADINAGKDWIEVSKARSTATGKDSGGEVGWLTNKTTSLEAPFRDAVFALAANAHTAVIEGEDGVFRIARVTDIAAGSVDESYRQQITDNGVSLDDYRSVVRSAFVQEALTTRIKDQAVLAGPQRHVQAIYLRAQTNSETGEPVTPSADAVKVRHILYAPKDDAQSASKLKPDDPAWKKAEDEARAAWQKLKADPSLFPGLARDASDDSGSGAKGGDLGYVEKDAAFVKPFLDAIFKEGVQPGQLLDPVKSEFGWHVIQVVSRGSDANEAADLKKQIDAGTDFAKLARGYSDGDEAEDGGDLGWIAHYEKGPDLESAIFNMAIGKVSDPITVEGDGIYLVKVLAEETRTPAGDQKKTLEDEAFNNWYTAQKKTFDIARDIDTSTGA